LWVDLEKKSEQKDFNAKYSLKKALYHYFQILEGNRLSNSWVSSLIPAHHEYGLEYLWKEHEGIRIEYPQLYAEFSREWTLNKPEFSYMDLKVEIAQKIFHNCIFCQRRCEINRDLEKGFCGAQEARISSEFLHMGEETPLIPSHTIFFAGCNFRCVYCQNWDISQNPQGGVVLSPERLAEIIHRRKIQGSRNVNFVGGDPTPHLSFILETMLLSEVNLPVVCNSNFYLSPEAMKLLDGFADLFLTDFKYCNDDCALRLSNAPNYWEIVTRNHKLALEAGDIIIRHLVLPNHLDCCTKPILDWICSNLGGEVVLNIMGQYRPVYGASGQGDISRFLRASELEEALSYARKLGFINLI
jgi:putative pyruvate formate lyase activating enzyme